MDEKSDIVKMESRAEKSKLVGVSMLLLSLLLTASVASLIYVAIANRNSGGQNTKQGSEVDVSSTVTFKSTEIKVKERVEYSRGGHMAYMYGCNGEFDFDDFRKGIHLTRNNENGVCYLIPVGANQTAERQVEGFLEEWDGSEVEVEGQKIQVEIFDGKLTDVSFLPQKVQNECTNGYQWMAIISKGDSTAEEGEVSRQKRDVYLYIICTKDGLCILIVFH